MKLHRGRLLACILLFLPILLLSGCDSYTGDADQLLRSVSIQAQLLENGNMQVTERWDISLYDRDKSYSNLFKSFPYSSEQQITDFSVTDNDTGLTYSFEGEFSSLYELSETPETCYLIANGQGTELGWFMPPVDEGDASFTLSYTVTNAVERYADVGVLYHGFIGKRFSIPITQFTAEILLPEGANQQDLRGWMHCTAESWLSIDSANHITLTASEIPAETNVETRICAPASLFPNAQRTSSETALEKISQEEQQWADEWEAQKERERFLALVSAIAAIVITAAGIVFGILCRVLKRRHKVEEPDYYREIPAGSSPGSAGALFYYYDGGIQSGEARNHVAAATMMSLARKKWITFEENPAGQQTKKKDDDLLIRIENGSIPLTPSENSFYQLLSRAAEQQDGCLTLQDFERYAKKHAQSYQNQMNAFVNAADNEIAPKGYFEKELLLVNAVRIISILALLMSVVLFFATTGHMAVFCAGLLVGGLFALILSCGKTRLSVQGETDLGIWYGLQRFLLDFSNMKEYGVFQLPLWEEYLVYAAMMGISDEVSEQLRKAYPQVWTSSEQDPNFFPRTSYLYWMYRPHYRHRAHFSFADQLSRTVDNAGKAAQNAINAVSGKGGSRSGGSGFGGGGFGGGGGGFGSGGGGGAR